MCSGTLGNSDISDISPEYKALDAESEGGGMHGVLKLGGGRGEGGGGSVGPTEVSFVFLPHPSAPHAGDQPGVPVPMPDVQPSV